MSKLKILVVSVEVAPFAKVGGLADVASSLPKALRALGHDARILMPAYGMVIRDPRYAAERVGKPFDVRVNPWWTVPSALYQTSHDGVPVYLLSGRGLFESISKSEELYSPTREAYLYFATAALRACEEAGWIPDVIHCNDWHTAFTPVMLREKGGPKWAGTASVFTIHNLAYQGEFGPDTVDAAGLPHRLYNMHQLETFGGVNFLKAGCVFADQVNTVSPTYAQEIQTAEYGCGLWGLMRDLAKLGRLRGILNGIDLDFFDPSKDPLIPATFDQDDLTGKAACKASLQGELGLPVDPKVPLATVVSRLSNQKGFDLMVRAAYGMLDLPMQYAVLGVGDPWAAEQLRLLEEEWPDRVRLVERFDAPLAQRFYAATDLFLMPSAFEPCGLGQMIAMRYGALPIVRRTGGLADTVFEGKNGFVFEKRSAREMFEAIKRGVATYHDSSRWSEMVQTAMSGDYGWEASANEYADMYEDALRSRRSEQVVGARS